MTKQGNGSNLISETLSFLPGTWLRGGSMLIAVRIRDNLNSQIMKLSAKLELKTKNVNAFAC